MLTAEDALCSIANTPGRSRKTPASTASVPEILFMALLASCLAIGKCGASPLVPAARRDGAK
jgi:hypothetical protein